MAPSQRLLFLDMGRGGTQDKTGRISSCNIDGSDQRTILDGLGPGPDGIAVDPEQKHIYWTNMSHPLDNTGSICRCNIDGSNPVTIIPQGKTFTPKQCIISPGSRKLYWCDREGMCVMRANLDGLDVETLVLRGEEEEDRKDHRRHCVGIAVDEGRGLVYWTQKGKSKGDEGRIFRVGLEMPKGETPAGRSDVECLLERLPEPIDLDLDVNEQTLYCTDRGDPPTGNTVYRVNVGEGISTFKKEVLVKKLHEGIGLTLDLKNRKMYIGDLAGSVYSANLDGSDKKLLVSHGGHLTGLALVEID